MPVIGKHELDKLRQALEGWGRVWVPAVVEGISRFVVWEEGVTPALATPGPTVVSAKEVFFPPTEKLYSYETRGLTTSLVEEAPEATPQVVLGLRACDVRAQELMDQVFLTKGYEDTYYQSRREKAVLVALACQKSAPTCFCQAFGIEPERAPGADVLMQDAGEAYAFTAQTPKGEEFLQSLAGVLQEGQAPAPAEVANTLEVRVDGLAEKLAGMFYHPIWDTLYQKCLGCGICTYLCPTCHCFDIQGRQRGSCGYRYRCWDSCMYSDYTLMAGGHNPRPTKKERVRNRFLDKLRYKPERYGMYGCVGCGRCLAKCPVNLDITRVIKDLQEVSLDA